MDLLGQARLSLPELSPLRLAYPSSLSLALILWRCLQVQRYPLSERWSCLPRQVWAVPESETCSDRPGNLPHVWCTLMSWMQWAGPGREGEYNICTDKLQLCKSCMCVCVQGCRRAPRTGEYSQPTASGDGWSVHCSLTDL